MPKYSRNITVIKSSKRLDRLIITAINTYIKRSDLIYIGLCTSVWLKIYYLTFIYVTAQWHWN